MKREQEIDFAQLFARLAQIDRALDASAAIDEVERRRMLRERAVALATAREEVVQDGLEVLVVELAGERFGFRIEQVDQVLEARGLTSLPSAPAAVLGIMVARNRVVPVLDLRVLLSLTSGGLADLQQVVVVEANGEQFGLAVETVPGRKLIPHAELEPAGNGPLALVSRDRIGVIELERLTLHNDASSKEG